ncbi:MAG: TIGR04283 family arsenosugar biosynthesis glycosyltransferase [Betaproteobacteria bacterium]
MHLSIIIPALNEAANIVATLAPLQHMRGQGTEVILVDGGSSDATRALAGPWVDVVIDSKPGRATQMNAGAAAATGEALLFLHADSRLPEEADQIVLAALAGAPTAWGRFDVAIVGHHFMFPVIAWCMNQRSRYTGIATGDQAIFMTREIFGLAGGFPDQALMEDIELCKRLKKRAPPVCRPEKIVTSGRRWEKHGLWRTILLMWRLRLRYWMGASPTDLHRAYYGN